MTTRVVGYVRVSTEEQAGSGVSLASQGAKLAMFAELHGLDLVELVEDAGVSAKSLKRPGLARVLGMLDAGEVSGVVVAKLDRLTRRVADWSDLIDRYFGDRAGKQLFSVGDSIDTRTAAGRLVLNVLMSVAEWERETIVERTRDAMRHKRSKGERLGEVPYGYQLGADGRTLDPCPAEIDGLAELLKLAAAGAGAREIARRLNALGIPAKRGGDWGSTSVRRILARSGPLPPPSPGARA